MKYTAVVNGDASFNIEKDRNGYTLNGDPAHADLQKLDDKRYHVLLNDASFTVEIVEVIGKEMQLVVNGSNYSVSLSDEYDGLLKALGISAGGASKTAGLKAPMPGLVLKLLVSEGEPVAKGQNLLILEAMKMENMIKAQSDCVIKAIHVKSGQTVEKGQQIFSFE